MSSNTIDFKKYIEDHTLRVDATRRGGGIEVDASDYLNLPGAKISAYQNYLGGGMLGSIQSGRNFGPDISTRQLTRAALLATALKRYFYTITNDLAGDWDEWAAADYEAVQQRPGSAF